MTSDNMDSVKTLAKGAGIVLAGLILSKIFTLIYRVFIAQFYGPTDYGIFSLGIAVLSLFAMTSLIGLQSGVVRFVSHYRSKKDNERVKGTIISSLKITLPLSIAMSIILALLSEFIGLTVFHETELVNVLMILSISIPFTTLMTILMSAFIGFKKADYRVYTENISLNSFKLLLILLFGIAGLGISGIAWAWTIATIMTFIVTVLLIRKLYPDIKSSLKSVEIKSELFKYSAPLLFTGTMGFIILWTDTIMIGIFMEASDVGIYNAAMPIGQILFMTANAIIALFLPVITELYSKNKIKKINNLYKTVSRWTLYVNLPIFLVLVFFSRQVLSIMFGPEYTSGYIVLVILSVGFMIKKTFPVIETLQMAKKTKNVMYAIASGTAANVILNIMLIPAMGINGAALASMSTYTISTLMMLFYTRKFVKISPFSVNMLKGIAAALISMAFTYILAEQFFTAFTIPIMAVMFTVFMLIYMFLLLVFRCFTHEDIELIKSIERSSGIKIGFVRNLMKMFLR
ncbi:MAG: oligosaccharide flippase family protein [Candidatus Aenigmarchaeota archaeon]|nr:oligosaccharide flippase family protein [Candidatus Aenigmarchaeota archaeon]